MKGRDLGGKYRDDPIGSEEPRGKSLERRKHRNDGNTLTPTEQHIKNSCMRQFMKNPEGTESANTKSYKASPAWCRGCDGRRLATSDDGFCMSCAPRTYNHRSYA